MKVQEAMTGTSRVASPKMRLQEAAQLMAEFEVDVLPVASDEQLVGMISDRDVAVRAVARGLGPDTEVQDVMTFEARYCFTDDDLDSVLREMNETHMRLMPVLDQHRRLVGIMSVGDLAPAASPAATAEPSPRTSTAAADDRTEHMVASAYPAMWGLIELSGLLVEKGILAQGDLGRLHRVILSDSATRPPNTEPSIEAERDRFDKAFRQLYDRFA